jgi:fructokinase
MGYREFSGVIVTQATLVGAIEGGGTRFTCAITDASAVVRERMVVPTTDPASTLGECVRFFQAAAGRHGSIAALGIACFGPLQLRADAPDHGRLMPTPKAGWSGASIVGPFRAALGVPVAIDTDVGAAAHGELCLGAGREGRSLAYVTVGTGIGGAVAPANADARLMHAEMGHLRVRRHPRDVDFAGTCPFHGDCLEGLASGVAIRARWQCDLSALPAGHEGRELIAGYVGQLAAAIALLHAPERVVIGGGVMADGVLLPLVRAAALDSLGGYLPPLRDAARMDAFIVPPALGAGSALAGAALLALALLRPAAAR